MNYSYHISIFVCVFYFPMDLDRVCVCVKKINERQIQEMV